MKAFLFPGQGSQRKGMGEALFSSFPDVVAQADAVLGYSVRELCVADPQGRLSQTEFTQPALFVVDVLSYLSEREKLGPPAFVAGHSLGEYAALHVAGAFDFELGLRLVQARGRAMAEVRGGAMAAVVGLTQAAIARALAEAGLSGVDLANLNSPSQSVISGLAPDVERAEAVLKRAGCSLFVRLNVSGPFHSRYMEPAQREFVQFLTQCSFRRLEIPVIANLTARPYDENSIHQALAEQILKPVRFHESIAYMREHGVTAFKELGPGSVLTGLVQRIASESVPVELKPTPTESKPLPPDASPEPVPTSELGSAAFRRAHSLSYAYVIGGMYAGISSARLVTAAARAGCLAFLGANGLSEAQVLEALRSLRRDLGNERPFGVNVLFGNDEAALLGLLTREGVRSIELGGYLKLTAPLVRYRLNGWDGTKSQHRVLAKVSRLELLRTFLEPAPGWMVERLLSAGEITREQAAAAERLPIADDICLDASAWGELGFGSALALLPSARLAQAELAKAMPAAADVRIGVAGGIGTPDAVAAAFVLGADFVLTGSINQCSVEANIGDSIKALLSARLSGEVDYAPIAATFSLGTKVPVLRDGSLYSARANKLLALSSRHRDLAELDSASKAQLARIFGEDRVTRAASAGPLGMRQLFDSYLIESGKRGRGEIADSSPDLLVPTSSALTAFNAWARGSEFESWRGRNIGRMAQALMQEATRKLNTPARTPSPVVTSEPEARRRSTPTASPRYALT